MGATMTSAREKKKARVRAQLKKVLARKLIVSFGTLLFKISCWAVAHHRVLGVIGAGLNWNCSSPSDRSGIL